MSLACIHRCVHCCYSSSSLVRLLLESPRLGRLGRLEHCFQNPNFDIRVYQHTHTHTHTSDACHYAVLALSIVRLAEEPTAVTHKLFFSLPKNKANDNYDKASKPHLLARALGLPPLLRSLHAVRKSARRSAAIRLHVCSPDLN